MTLLLPAPEGSDERATDPMDETTESPRRTPEVRPSRWVPALLLAQALIAADLDLPVVRPLVALTTMLALPTFLLYRKVSFPTHSALPKALYAFGTSLLGLIGVGLVLDVALPLVGVDHPLQPLVLAVTWFGIDVALVLWRREPVQRPDLAPVLRRALALRIELAQALAAVAVVLSVVGAVRLNNHAGGAVALAAHVVAALALVALMVRPGSLGRDARVLGLVATTLLLATSLRGWGITGHDIQAEYFAFKLTDGNQHWSMDALQNAYNACLSVNILPTVLSQTTGLSGVTVFKVVLQLVFALVPVLTYLLSRRFLPRRLALAAAVFTLAFPTFFTDMPYLVRQEVAFFFLALLLLVATEPDQPASRLRLLVGVFGVGVVLSHYSTTYVMLMGLVAGLVVVLVRTLVDRRSGRPAEAARAQLVLLHPGLVAALALASLMWAGPATHTGGHAGEVAKETIAAIFGHGDGSPGSSDLSYGLFSRDDVKPRQRLDRFVDETMRARRQAEPGELLIRHPGPREKRPDIVPAARLPLTGAGRALDSVGLDPTTLNAGARLACAGLLQVFLLVGLVVMLARRRRSGSRAVSGPDVPREAAYVAVGAVAALGVIVLVPSLSVEYGVLRAFQQTLLVTAPLMAAGMAFLLRPFSARGRALAVAVPVALLLVLCGALPSLLGGNQGRIALQNSGLYYDRYVASDSDVDAMTWLAGAKHLDSSRPKVIASRNNGIRITSAGQTPVWVADRLFPTILTRGSYVFVDSHLARKRQSTVFYSGDLITYRYPLQDLARRLDLVYSAGRSRVYR